jgi:hypothetical protein
LADRLSSYLRFSRAAVSGGPLVTDSEQEFLTKLAPLLERVSEQCLAHHQPMLSSLIDLARAEAADVIRTRAHASQRFCEFKLSDTRCDLDRAFGKALAEVKKA